MKLLSIQEIHLYAVYLNFGLTKSSAYQSVITIRKARTLMEIK